MTKLALFAFVVALVLCMGVAFAEYDQNTLTRVNVSSSSDSSISTTDQSSSEGEIPNLISPAVTTSTSSTGAIASCTVTESLQSEINDLLGKLQDAEKSNDTQMMTEIKQKISRLGEEFDKQRETCLARANAVPTQATSSPPTGTITETTNIQPIAEPIKPVSAQSATTITSTCIDESIQNRWKELATQLESAVENNDTGLINQIQPEIESLGQEIVNQIKEKCSSYVTGNVPLLSLFCPVEAAMYASLEKQKNSLMAQEYQARTSGNTELASQLYSQIEALNTEAAKYTESCQAKLLASDTAKYFMTSTTNAYISPTTTKQVQQVPGVISSSETNITAVPTTATQVAVASVCYIPYELEKKLKEAWNEYYTLVKAEPIDMEKMKVVKDTISSAEQEINKIKQNCQPQANVTTVTTAKICPVVMSPDFEQKCAARNGTITKNFDNSGCLSGYDCVTSTGIISPTSTTISQPTAPGQVIRPGENCTVPVELTQEFEGLWKNYKKALSNNDTQKAEAFRTKISEIEKKISETKGQCVKTIVTEKMETKDVVTYYKQKVTEVMTQETDTDVQIEQLKGLRGEIDKLITELISKNKRLNASDVSGIVDEIKVKSKMIQAGNSTIVTTEAKISTQINKQDVEINPSNTGVVIREGNITLDSTELTIKDNKVSIDGTEINIAPSAVVVKARIQNMKTLNLTSENGTPIYGITGDENRKLFLIIPVTIEKQVTVDASTGDIIKEERPWWAILTSE